MDRAMCMTYRHFSHTAPLLHERLSSAIHFSASSMVTRSRWNNDEETGPD
ncbi:hypothetical protein WN55_10780 [Dufourea novaeangliae]|uniref:Uncharacterized protein n=1 Tax=Dufourea novaeangliae TaxID=178035 RepID=A0A154PAA8_DUFNO|nr:hypothetical protein WN55_10780 [Dufourea novaeangliae]